MKEFLNGKSMATPRISRRPGHIPQQYCVRAVWLAIEMMCVGIELFARVTDVRRNSRSWIGSQILKNNKDRKLTTSRRTRRFGSDSGLFWLNV
jgi:hypothetical protein